MGIELNDSMVAIWQLIWVQCLFDLIWSPWQSREVERILHTLKDQAVIALLILQNEVAGITVIATLLWTQIGLKLMEDSGLVEA